MKSECGEQMHETEHGALIFLVLSTSRGLSIEPTLFYKCLVNLTISIPRQGAC